jgi:hypothetical protein
MGNERVSEAMNYSFDSEAELPTKATSYALSARIAPNRAQLEV